MSSNHRNSLLGRLLLLLALSLPVGVQAANVNYCVNSSAELIAAFASASAETEGSAQKILLRPGTYNVPGGLVFFPPGDKDNKFVEVSGGWNANCTQASINPSNTVINFENGAVDGDFKLIGDHSFFKVVGIRFINFNNWLLNEPPCPTLNICSDTYNVQVRFNEFRQGKSVYIVSEDASEFTVSNNLFANITGNFGAVVIEYYNNEEKPTISFNTFAALQCVNSGDAAVYLLSQIAGATLHHNIFQSSGCSSDFGIESAASGQSMVLRNNLYATRSGLAPSASSNNVISSNPGFVNAAGGDFHLRESAPISAAINAGMTPVQANQLLLSLPAQDLDGPAGTRIVGTRVDIGAYESSVNDSSVLTVLNTNDSGAGSLRQALLSANAAPGLQRVEFNIPGACPRLILLDTPLPDITDSLEIDGYTQPGAAANTQAFGTDALLCITILASAGTLDQALQVPQAAAASTSLSVQGIAFAGSTGFNGNFTVAIRLRGGSDHLIQGNAFAGTGPGAIGSLGTLNFGLQIRGLAQNVLVGGPDPEHRNSFGDMISSAVVLNDDTSSGHTIQNNYIGLSANGQQASPIGLNGIFASGNAGLRILDNVIASVANSAAISISGATASGYTIRGNKIGVNAYGIPTAALRNSVGIMLANGSGGHQIGSAAGATASNVITNSDSAGVWLTPSAGSGTIIRPNQVYSNGLSGTGLGIDLGALGPSSNDPLDADGGPDNGQNWPQITASNPNPDGSRAVSLSLASSPNTSYRVDIYRAPDCPAGNRGANLSNRVTLVTGTTNAQGLLVLNFTMSGNGAPGYLSAIATTTGGGDTSEPGPCFLEPTADAIFANGYE